jgi:hypothetical protein
LIEHWNGTTWSIVTSPNAQGNGALSGVTCSSASDCWAVGVHYISSVDVDKTLIEHWNGTAWSIVASPNTSATQDNNLSDVTCASASNCWAVGQSFGQTLTEHWNGTAWSIVSSANTSTGHSHHLLGVTCTSASDCWAVGDYFTGSIENHPAIHTLIERWNGTAWSIVTSPSTTTTPQLDHLRDVTCASASDCWAVGDHSNNTLTEHWNGTAWSIVTSPNAMGPNYLYGVTCTSASDCWAVGYYGFTGGFDFFNQTLIERYSPIVPGALSSISSRVGVEAGDNVLIGGFVIGGTDTKQVLVRALGPTLGQFGVTGVLQNPVLELHNSAGALILSNDNWAQAANAQSIPPDFRPPNSLESAILINLNPGAYTAVVRGVNNTTGVGLVEIYDLSPTSSSHLTSISARGLVQLGDDVMIAGVTVQSGSKNVLVRALGPTLAGFGISNPLANPTLELHDANGALISSNDNWKSTQQTQIAATGKAPPDDLESAIMHTLAPGNYTAIVRGVNNTSGVALVEVYSLN